MSARKNDAYTSPLFDLSRQARDHGTIEKDYVENLSPPPLPERTSSSSRNIDEERGGGGKKGENDAVNRVIGK